jgi:phospholipid/cholesterol/gamma-HCH transport system substrate-binding protein
MKTSAPQKIKVGILVLAGLLIFTGGIFVIGKNKNIFGHTMHIYGTFRNVNGLQIGNNVRFVGINIGTVEGISIISDTFARVDMRLQEHVKPFLKKNAVASISSDGLMGDKLITITGSSEPGEQLNNDSRINTVDPADFDKAMSKLSVVANNAEKITNSLASIFSEISSGKGSVGSLLYNDTLAKTITATVKTANKTLNNIKEGSEGFSENMKAAKHNFLLRGYFRKKEKKAQKKREEQEQNNTQPSSN